MTANQIETRLHRVEQFIFGNDPKKWPKGYVSDLSNKQALGIEKVICEYFNLLPEEVRSSKRIAELIWPRFLLMFFLRQNLSWSTLRVGEFLGRHHTASIHAFDQVNNRIKLYPADRKQFEQVAELIRRHV